MGGLCFKCGERWDPEHKCRLKHYRPILWKDDGDSPEEEEAEVESAEEEFAVEAKPLQLSLASFKGLTSNESLKVWGEILGRLVTILINLGATCNFLSKTVVAKLKLEMAETPKYIVEVGNSQLESSQGVCNEVSIWVQGIEKRQPFFLLELGGMGVVLGVDWLATLGKIEADF